jgi:hypothetical protein
MTFNAFEEINKELQFVCAEKKTECDACCLWDPKARARAAPSRIAAMRACARMRVRAY